MKEVSIKDIKDNAVGLISDRWMLVTAGNESKFNTMTASWGFVGEMWNKDCAICAIRPQRYTYEFLEKFDRFTLSFLEDGKKIHAICGSKSGRDTDKCAETGLKPIFDGDTVYFEQASIVIVCKKIYSDTIKPDGFVDCLLDKTNYPGKDYHKLYIGEIEKVLIKE